MSSCLDYKSCSQILINTHRPDNIDLLKARDYYFDKARWYSRFFTFFTLLPMILVVLSYITLPESWHWLQDSLEYLIGIVTFFSFFAVYRLKKKIDSLVSISNMLREEYDLRVLGLDSNPFAYDCNHLEEYLKKAAFKEDHGRYESWYSEIFCPDHEANVICCQMDNCIYTYYVYRDTAILLKLAYGLVWFLLVIVTAVLFLHNDLSKAFLFIIAMGPILDFMYNSIQNTNELIESNRRIIDQVKTLNPGQNNRWVLRCLQDEIVNNRNHSLMILKSIRVKYLRPGNPYFKELDQFKAKWMDRIDPSNPQTSSGFLARKIESVDEIPVLPLSYAYQDHPGENPPLVPMSQIHSHLLTILQDVIQVWESHGIRYTLDGGTLLGAIREKGKFLFWDDDVDLIIPFQQLKQAKQLILDTLGDRYDLQDFETEKFYSPRLSNFRIREKNSVSRVSEKDSPLYRSYHMQGLFVDVYAYTPIVGPRWLDGIYRMLWLHPLNASLQKLENRTIFCEDPHKRKMAEQAFLRKKQQYLRRVRTYCRIGHSSRYVGYTPNYLDNLSRPGPYIPAEALTGDRHWIHWENREYAVPKDPVVVLESVYGSGWNQSPHKTADQLRSQAAQEGLPYPESLYWYSRDHFCASVLKHLSCVDLQESDT